MDAIRQEEIHNSLTKTGWLLLLLLGDAVPCRCETKKISQTFWPINTPTFQKKANEEQKGASVVDIYCCPNISVMSIRSCLFTTTASSTSDENRMAPWTFPSV